MAYYSSGCPSEMIGPVRVLQNDKGEYLKQRFKRVFQKFQISFWDALSLNKVVRSERYGFWSGALWDGFGVLFHLPI